MPIDVRHLRENPSLYITNQQLRKLSTDPVTSVLKADSAYRERLALLENLTAYRKRVQKNKKSNKSSKANTLKFLKPVLVDLKISIEKLSESISLSIRYVASLPPSIPLAIPAAPSSPQKRSKPYHMILSSKFRSAHSTSYSRRSYFLTGSTANLVFALSAYGRSFLRRRGYVSARVPHIMSRECMEGVCQLNEFDDTLFSVEKTHVLIATSEQSMCYLHANETLEEKNLPLRYVASSPCYRKEAGSRKDRHGMFRVHEFDKIEQFGICKHETEARSVLAEFVSNAMEFYKSLGLCVRAVRIPPDDLNLSCREKIDLEAWFPGSAEWRELVSASDCGDFQSRASNVWVNDTTTKKKKKKKKTHAHFVNATLVASQRTACCILENYLIEGGGVRVPDVLVPYMDGEKVLY